MKPLFISLGIILAGILGYKNEPSLRYQLTGIRPGKLTDKSQATAPIGQPLVDPATLTADQLPEKVQLCADVKVTDPVADVTMTIQAGNKVKLVRIEGTNVVVSPGAGPYTGILPIADTDLMAQLAANPPVAATPSTDSTAAPTGGSADPATVAQPATVTDPATATNPAPAPATPATDPAPTPATDPATDPAPAPATDPAPAPATDPAPATATDPAPATATDPAPTPATDPASPATPATPADPVIVAKPAPVPTPAIPAVPGSGGAVGIVPIMQASIRSGQIKAFAFAQVLGWKAEPNETVDGEVFQAGTVTYKAETIFGVKTIQAKALIKGGKVQRWIWPKSGMEIK